MPGQRFFPERLETRLWHGEPHKFYVCEEGDLYVLREMYEMQPSVYEVDVRRGMQILDIGAHKGIFTVWAAKQGACVTAYEPSESSYVILLRNLKLNEITAETHMVGVWSNQTTKPFYIERENSIGSTFLPGRIDNFETVETALEPFDDIIGNKNWDIVKLDAEGAEYQMLLSSEKLSQIALLTLEWHCPPEQEDCPELYATIDKCSQFFDVQPLRLDWRILTMRRKGYAYSSKVA